MNKYKLFLTMAEARRFLRKAEEAMKVFKEDRLSAEWGCKETGAVRRASMDLTRSLAELRKVNR